MSANQWMNKFHELIRMKSEKLAQCELEKGDLEATVMVIGSKIIEMFPESIRENEGIADAVIRLLCEYDELKKRSGEQNGKV